MESVSKLLNHYGNFTKEAKDIALNLSGIEGKDKETVDQTRETARLDLNSILLTAGRNFDDRIFLSARRNENLIKWLDKARQVLRSNSLQEKLRLVFAIRNGINTRLRY